MNSPSPRTQTRQLLLALLVAVLPLALFDRPSIAREDEGEETLLEHALAELAEDIGVWHSRWEQLDAEGNVRSEFEGTETGRYLMGGDRVVEITTEIPEINRISTSLRFYNPNTRMIEFASVDQRGVYWFLHAEPGGDTLTSHLHTNADGSRMMIRFVTVEKRDGWQLVHREDSLDEGQSWRLGARQYRTVQEDQ